MLRWVLRLLSSLALWLIATVAAAQLEALPAPKGPVVLTASGLIEVTNGDGVARFDRAMLESLGLERITTTTAWTEGPQEFEGVRASTLVAALGAKGNTVHSVALNDYAVDIPLGDFTDYPVLLALKMNGRYLRLRDKGPIWIVYPRDRFSALQDVSYNQRWIWQLRELIFQQE